MNPILKASIAAAITLGAVSAHAAGFAVPTTSNPGDLILFAEVLNSSGTVVGSYAGDTGVTVLGTQAAITANQTASMSDGGNLASLLALDTGTNSLVWSIQGGGQLSANDYELADAGAAQFVTTAAGNNTGQLGARPSGVLDSWNAITNTAISLNTLASTPVQQAAQLLCSVPRLPPRVSLTPPPSPPTRRTGM